MRSRWLPIVVLGLAALTAAGNRGPAADEKDPVINGTPLSELVERFETAKTADEKIDLSFAIAKGRQKSKAAVPVLVGALNDKNGNVRINICTALGMIGPAAKEAVPALIETLTDPDRPSRSRKTGPSIIPGQLHPPRGW